MGVTLEHGNLISTHGFRSTRRRAAITRREAKVCDLQKAVSTVELELAKSRALLRNWESWWEASYSFDAVIVGGQTGPLEESHFEVEQLDPSTSQLVQVALRPAAADIATQTDDVIIMTTEDPTDDDTIKMTATKLESLLNATYLKATVKMEKRMTDMLDKFTALAAELSAAKQVAEQTLWENDDLQKQVATLSRERDGLLMHVEELQAELAVKFDESCSEGESYDEIQASVEGEGLLSPEQCRMDLGDQGLARNDLGLRCCGTVVDWEAAIPDVELVCALRTEQLRGLWKCLECRQDLLSLHGNYGNVVMKDNFDDQWESKHVMSLLGQPAPAFLRCLRCHYGTVRCRFFQQGWCRRGAACAYQHIAQTSHGDEILADNAAANSAGTTWRWYLSASDFSVLAVACIRHRDLVNRIMNIGVREPLQLPHISS